MQWSGGVFDWAKTHNCEFGIEKFQLLDASKKLIPNPLNPRRRIPQPQQTLTLGEQCIPSKETVQFLGVLVDNKLNWKVQCTAALTKGQDWLIQFSKLTCMACGINAKYIQQLYLSITVPCMLYADLSHPTTEHRKKSKKQLQQTSSNKQTSFDPKESCNYDNQHNEDHSNRHLRSHGKPPPFPPPSWQTSPPHSHLPCHTPKLPPTTQTSCKHSRHTSQPACNTPT